MSKASNLWHRFDPFLTIWDNLHFFPVNNLSDTGPLCSIAFVIKNMFFFLLSIIQLTKTGDVMGEMYLFSVSLLCSNRWFGVGVGVHVAFIQSYQSHRIALFYSLFYPRPRGYFVSSMLAVLTSVCPSNLLIMLQPRVLISRHSYFI